MQILRSIQQLFLISFLIFVYSTLSASEITAFGPRQYLRTTGAPNMYTKTFSLDGETSEIISVQTISRRSEPGRVDYPTVISRALYYAHRNTPYTCQARITGPDNDLLSYSLQQASEDLVIDPVTGLIECPPPPVLTFVLDR